MANCVTTGTDLWGTSNINTWRPRLSSPRIHERCAGGRAGSGAEFAPIRDHGWSVHVPASVWLASADVGCLWGIRT
jgi:hypothetical protein